MGESVSDERKTAMSGIFVQFLTVAPLRLLVAVSLVTALRFIPNDSSRLNIVSTALQ